MKILKKYSDLLHDKITITYKYHKNTHQESKHSKSSMLQILWMFYLDQIK